MRMANICYLQHETLSGVPLSGSDVWCWTTTLNKQYHQHLLMNASLKRFNAIVVESVKIEDHTMAGGAKRVCFSHSNVPLSVCNRLNPTPNECSQVVCRIPMGDWLLSLSNHFMCASIRTLRIQPRIRFLVESFVWHEMLTGFPTTESNFQCSIYFDEPINRLYSGNRG